MERIYQVPFAYERYGRISVAASSRQEAAERAEEALSQMSMSEMEANSSYLPDSEEIDYEGTMLDENGNILGGE